MIQTEKRDIKEDGIKYLEELIATNKDTKVIPSISNYQLRATLNNLIFIKTQNEPTLIEAASNAGGFTYYYYYKAIDGTVYLLEFYMQEFRCWYNISKDNNLLQSWIEHHVRMLKL